MSFNFFRKYNKLILAVGGSILMVLFLLPQAPGMFGGGGGRNSEIGTLADKALTQQDLSRANSEMRMLVRLNPAIAPNPYMPFAIPGGQNAPTEWLLMLEEADRMGIYASAQESADFLAGWQVDPQTLADVRLEFGASEAAVLSVVRNYLKITQLKRLAFASPMLSEPELRRLSRDILTQLDITIVPIRAEWYVDEVGEPADADIEARYTENRTDVPGTTEPYGFGYMLPPRVKIEVLSIPLDRAKDAVTIEETELYEYYTQNTDRFLPSLLTDTTEGPLLSEDGTLVTDKPKPYKEVRDQIVDIVSGQKASQLQQRMINSATAHLNESTRSWGRDDDGFFNVPENASTWLAMEEVQKDLQTEFGLLPDLQRYDNDWVGLDAIQEDSEGIAQSFMQVNNQILPAIQYIGTAREFNPPSNPLRLQVGIASKPLQGLNGTIYVFRLIGADGVRSPENLAEVRDRVVADCKKLNAYGDIQRKVDAYLSTAGSDGMRALSNSLGQEEPQIAGLTDVSKRISDPQSISFRVPDLELVGQSSEFVDKLFDQAEAAIAADKLEDLSASDRFIAIPVDSQQTVYIAEITGVQPVNATQYLSSRDGVHGKINQEEMARTLLVNNPFTYEALSERLGFVPTVYETEDDEEGEGSETDAPVEEETETESDDA